MFALVVFLVALTSALPVYQEDPLYPQFRQWMAKYQKLYLTEAVEGRFNIWKKSFQMVQENNQATKNGKEGALFGLNKFSDLSPEEFKQTYLLKDIQPTPEDKRTYLDTIAVSAPKSFDWRSKGKVTAVKDQGQCGSCWAFSATENIESVWMIKKGLTNSTMKPLSPQQIVDCDGTDGGCGGGDTPTAFKYVIHAGGLETEKEYPYRAVDEKCHFEKSKIVAHITGWKYATSHHDEKVLMDNLVAESPLSICVDAEKWQYYDSGVMTASQCAKHVSLDHCVQLVGYDMSGPKHYWLVRNSWGTSWGEHGYIRLEYGHNTCGVTDEATTATL